ncbi:MAG: amidophosphoribosyltransferase [Eubacteriales bacterium]|nr:amidophosphoribosyltransferase [Eubacteriales bacterium]
MGGLREECGVFGIISKENTDVAASTYYGLFALQHRGQESCGIVVNNGGAFSDYKDTGLVNDVFTADRLHKLGTGNMAVGHVRYGTTGGKGRINAQPIVVENIKGHTALAHNGNLTNYSELRRDLELGGAIFHTTNDTEVISYIITQERLTSDSIEEATVKAMSRIKGAYSLVIMSSSKLIAVRDPKGFRPLCYGVTEDGSYVIASESCAIDSVGAKFIRDVLPGEIIVFTKDSINYIDTHCNTEKQSFCVFEYIYFSRPDSQIEGKTVQSCRVRAGEFLAKEHSVQADVVIGVPDSGLDAAIGYSRESGIPYEIGFIKNKYIGRTFISPGQTTREDGVRIKLNVISDVVKGKRVVLIDDSIVRGTTCRRIVGLLREAGATEVHMRVSAPPFLNPCYYGTDIDSKENLIACNYTLAEITTMIGVDSLGYLSLEDAMSLAGEEMKDKFCTACFNGAYPTEISTNTYTNLYNQENSSKNIED